MAPWTTAEGERGKNWSHDRPSVLILVGLLVTIPSTIFIFTRTRYHSWANSFVTRSGRNNRSKKTWLPLIATEIRIRFDNFSGERTSPCSRIFEKRAPPKCRLIKFTCSFRLLHLQRTRPVFLGPLRPRRWLVSRN